MSRQSTNLNPSKSTALVLFEHLLLVLCLCAIALRTTVTEGLSAQSTETTAHFAGITYSLTISAGLVCAFVIYFLWRICGRFAYRFSGMEIGLCLFCAAAVIAWFAASNKRAAVTNCLSLIAPVLAAVLLVQILNSDSKVRLVLIVIVALGAVSAWQCKEQLFYWNEQQIKFYEADPSSVLAEQNIASGSLQQFQYEHRLYSKGVNGFFTTRNSAGCFFLLALFAAVALVIEQFNNRRDYQSSVLPLMASILAAAAILLGLAVTKSKAAIAAALLSVPMLTAYFCFNTWLKAHKKAVLIGCSLLVVAGTTVFVAYTLTHDKPPGGNSMLVRWQYWTSSVKMYADHSITGVGPANFACFYPRYKNHAALEAVSDPHNFVLSILTQYGPIGLAGFLALVFVPLLKIIFSAAPASPPSQTHQAEPSFAKAAVFCAIAISAVLLVVRPMLLTIPETGSPEEKKAAALMLYIMPAVIFAITFVVLALTAHNKGNVQSAAAAASRAKPRYTNTTVAVLFCAVLAALAHNLLDFAIFEPGIYITFWALLAALVASDFNHSGRPPLVAIPHAYTKAAVAAVGAAVVWACLQYAVIGPVKAAAKIEKAEKAAMLGRFGQAHNLLDAAADDDYLSPAALSINALLYRQQAAITPTNRKALLLRAESCLVRSSRRNPADYKNFTHLADIYTLLAHNSTDSVRTDWLKRSFDSAASAVKLYPGSGKLHIELAGIAEQLGETKTALVHYKKAVDIEDAFRKQFQQMYPEYKIISRLGEDKYRLAKQRLKDE